MGTLAQEFFKISFEIFTPLQKTSSKVWLSRFGFVVEDSMESKFFWVFVVATNWSYTHVADFVFSVYDHWLYDRSRELKIMAVTIKPNK